MFRNITIRENLSQLDDLALQLLVPHFLHLETSFTDIAQFIIERFK